MKIYLAGLALLCCSCGSVSEQDGTALATAQRTMEIEYSGLATAFEAIAARSVGDEAKRGALLARIGQSRAAYNTMARQFEMALAQLMQVNYEQLYNELRRTSGWALGLPPEPLRPVDSFGTGRRP